MSLSSAKSMSHNRLVATDGEIGRCKDMLFCDSDWMVRYLVVDTHKWLPFGRKLVISPISVDWQESGADTLRVRLTRAQIKDSPPLAEHEPLSREYEKALFDFYGYTQYWAGSGGLGTYTQPAGAGAGQMNWGKKLPSDENHLRSVGEMENYRIKCGEQVVGHVVDFAFEKPTWAISHLVVDTQNWPGGNGQRLLPVAEVDSVEWTSRSAFTSLAAQQFSALPAP